jgi:hypothetical protein
VSVRRSPRRIASRRVKRRRGQRNVHRGRALSYDRRRNPRSTEILDVHACRVRRHLADRTGATDRRTPAIDAQQARTRHTPPISAPMCARSGSRRPERDERGGPFCLGRSAGPFPGLRSSLPMSSSAVRNEFDVSREKGASPIRGPVLPLSLSKSQCSARFVDRPEPWSSIFSAEPTVTHDRSVCNIY